MIAARICFLRKKAGLSQAMLAKKLNISASAEGMYEQGRRMPSLDLLVKFSTIFDVSLDYLITGSEFHSSKTHEEQLDLARNCPCSTCFWKQYLDV